MALAGCLVGGFFTGRAFPESEKSHLDSWDICNADDFQQQVAAFERILPEGKKFASSAKQRISDYVEELSEDCRITIDGKNAFYLESQTVLRSVDEWEKWMLGNEIISRDGLKTFDAGTRALSSPNAAAIYFRCSRKDSEGRTMALSIDVSAQGAAVSKTGAHRQDLAEIAVQAARVATSLTQCQSADPLPQGALPALD
ncbi:hypothetical protein [Streptomyces sp. NPDC057623]|uniref:hypothetical protein n=1 Tax=Streptomyces sp. NPDC057623 TaxID=3346187 RepID=UPI00369E1B9D